jgi:hypothetical protein
MAERRIEIQMAAVGAQEAAAGISQSTEEVKRLAAEQAKLASDQAAAQRQRQQDAEEEAEDLRQNVENHKGRAREIGAAVGLVATAAKFATDSLTEVAQAISSVDMDRLNRVDPTAAEEFKKIEFWAKAATSPVNALIEATSKWVFGDTVAGAFADMNIALAKAAEDHAETIDKMIQSGIRQTNEIKRLADEVKAANAILDATDAADAAARQRSNAARIRAGEPKEQVEKEQAAYEAEREVAKIERERAAAEQAAAAAMLEADQARTNAQAVDASEIATPEDRLKARAAARAAQARAAEMMNQSNTARRIADQRIRQTRETEAARIEEIDGTAAAAQQRADAEMFAQHAEFNDRLERDEARRQAESGLDSARDGLNRSAASAAGKFGIAADRAPNRAVGGALDRIGASLEDGTSAAEIARLQQQFSKATAALGGATVAAMQKMLNELETQAKRIEVVESQIKNGRRGR